MKLESFARYPLLFGPSPVHPLERMTAHLGGARIWAKRDDCNSGLAFGGNKVRKLEYLIADARRHIDESGGLERTQKAAQVSGVEAQPRTQ